MDILINLILQLFELSLHRPGKLFSLTQACVVDLDLAAMLVKLPHLLR
jgi:hypothetical protein